MPPTDYYSLNYDTARHRFRAASAALNAQQEQHAIRVDACPDEDLSVDVAWIGSDEPEWTVVVSSGLHGVEGFFGSAVQLAWLSQFAINNTLPGNGRIVFMHAINPYGFRYVRRVNEDNADLNRNFMHSGQPYAGRPEGYDKLYNFLNPKSPPYLLGLFRLKALWFLARHGLPALKTSIVTGQYDYPQGVFFGGQQLALSACIVQANYKRWVGGAAKTIHLDLHTGLGKYGTHKLLLSGSVDDSHLDRCRRQFGQDRVEVTLDENGTAYRSNGTMGNWLSHYMSDIDYTHFLAEFGTYAETKSLGAVCADNRAHLYGKDSGMVFSRIKSHLMECFCPSSGRWRNTCLVDALELVDQCIHVASGAAPEQEVTLETA